MSEQDSFIQEVTEEVRQDQMLAYWKKYGLYIIAGVVATVGAAAGWSWMQAEAGRKAAETGAAILEAARTGPDALADLAPRIDEGPAIVAAFAHAASLAADGAFGEAAAAYDALSRRTDVGPEYTDLAALQAVLVQSTDPDARPDATRLDALIVGNSPYRLLAMEVRAGLDLAAGETERAHADLSEILTEPTASAGLRQRAAALLIASGGTLPERAQ